MEEGMIYVLFNSEDGSSPPDSVFRAFWVNSPDIRFSFFDSFLVSERLSSGQWAKTYPRGILKNRSPRRSHQEVSLEEYDMVFDGTWQEGYSFTFEDRLNHISGELEFEPLSSKGVLVYYNGREATTPSMVQRFYDMFAIRVTGELKTQGNRIQLNDGRGIIEHGLGIFSTLNIQVWRWLNLQFPEGSIHLFYHSLNLGDEGIVESGEGAAVMNGRWAHFPPGDFRIEETGYENDENLSIRIPVEWRVTAGDDSSGNPRLDLTVRSTAYFSWSGELGTENEYVTNYVLEARGTWEGKSIVGKGTMENQMH